METVNGAPVPSPSPIRETAVVWLERVQLSSNPLPQMHFVPTRHENERGKLAERCSWTGQAKTTPDPPGSRRMNQLRKHP